MRHTSLLPLVLLAWALVTPSARANVLVYEGFHPADYGNVATDESKTASAAFTPGHTVGVSNSKWNAMGGSQIKVFGENYGLALPAAMTDEGFSAQGGSIGLNPDGSSAGHRAMSHNLADNVLKVSSGTLYVRMLLNLDSTAAVKLAAGASLTQKDGGYFGFGFGKTPSGNNYYAPTSLQSALSFVIWKNSSNQYVLSFVHTSASGTEFTSYPIVTGITLGATYICYAEVRVGAGVDGKEIVRAGAMAVDDYTTDVPWTALDGDSDSVEVELITDTDYPSCMAVAGPYGTKNGSTKGYFRADEIVVGTEIEDVLLLSSTAPKLSDGSLVLSGGIYTASVTLAQSDANVTYTLSDGDDATAETPVALGTGSFTAGSIATGTFAAPTDDTTYEVELTAENAGGEAVSLSLGTIYGGTLTLAKVSDGNELGFVPATLTVSRMNADPLPLVVNYVFAPGTAVAGVNYVDNAGTITIPAGATSATIVVTPLVDAATDSDTSLTVSIVAGNYTAPAAGVTVTIANFTTPAGYNYWLGGIATVGKYLASTAANWSAGHAPTASENVVFDGGYSTADCTWDAFATATVASWTQTANYTGTVEFQTTYANGGFPVFSIAGDCTVNGGTWTHTSNMNVANNAAAQYRLNVSVVGDFTLGESAKIDMIGRGYNVGCCPLGSQVGVHAATAHGTYSAVYGNVLAPEDIGSGGESGGQYGPNNSSGGGAAKLTVTGTAVIDGTITANASKQYVSGNPEKGYGAGGSVFITASSISGSGTIDVSARPSGVSETAYSGYAGSGGRMALVATAGDVSIPFANLLANGSWGGYSAGAGTIYLKNATDTNGSLLVGTSVASWSFSVRYVRKDGCTCVKPGETWTFDHIYVRDRGILSVPENATLVLPGGFESVSSLTDSSTPLCGILYLGGTISLPARQEHVLSGPWMFMAVEPFTFQGDVRLTSKASIGSFQLYADSVAAYPACIVSVTGDMTVESGASLYANNRGRRGADAKSQGYHGGSVAATAHHLKAYDSILFPTLGGTGGRSGDMGATCPAGGAIVLTVGGRLTLNGNANAGSTDISASSHLGAAGTINITAGSLVGSGNITANGGGSGNAKSRGAGGGGRVAVRLTDPGATFTDFSGTISAQGNNANSATTDAGSSAGTVYLQDGATKEGAGTIKVANISSSTAVDAKTGYPSLSDEVAIDDLSLATLEISNNSRVILIAEAETYALKIESGSSLDVAGKKLTVRHAKVGENKLSSGTYTAISPAVAGYLADSGEDGALIVQGNETIIFLK